jgi:hypothetical protein
MKTAVHMTRTAAALAIVVAGLGLAACDQDDGPAEKVGESIDQGVEDTGEALKGEE